MKTSILLLVLLVALQCLKAQEITSYPYIQSFDSTQWASEGWSEAWQHSPSYGPYFGNTPWERSNDEGYQSDYAMSYSSNNESQGYLFSPKFRLDNVLDATFSFKYLIKDVDYSSSAGPMFRVRIRVNQGPWVIVFSERINDNENYWKSYDTTMVNFLPATPEPTIVEFEFWAIQGWDNYDLEEMYIDNVKINNVVYAQGYEPGDYTAQYGWEKVDSVGLLLPDGKLAINSSTIDPNFDLWVNGSMKAGEILVLVDSVPDYVFDEDYILKSLPEIESYIEENHHLPGIPSETEMEATGADLGSLNMKLLEKIEELTLHMIELEKKYRRLEEIVYPSNK